MVRTTAFGAAISGLIRVWSSYSQFSSWPLSIKEQCGEPAGKFTGYGIGKRFDRFLVKR